MHERVQKRKSGRMSQNIVKMRAYTDHAPEKEMEFGKLLTQLRREKGVLQKDVANQLNVTVATISNYEKGVHLPDLNTLIMLADYFDVSTDYLLQRTDYKSSINMLNHQLSADYTISDMLNTMVELDAHNTQSLLDYCELLTLRNSINRVK